MLRLFYHPLASFCHKVLMALYENGTPFERELVDLMDAESRARYLDRWPIGKMPILFDEKSGRTIPESSIIIEYLDQHYPGANPLLPEGDSQRLDVRLWDRFFDLYVQTPMQKIVGDRLRSDSEHDPRGVADAKASLQAAYDMIERQIATRTWATGEHFTMADCAASPALFYAGIVAPFEGTHPKTAAYFDRLAGRASFKRLIGEARPYLALFPFKESVPSRFL
jgi:glutathione S-transferase